jgi:hypothetical protein
MGSALLLTRRLSFFETLGVTESVQSVVCAGTAGTNTRQHEDFNFFARKERVSQNHR